MRQKQLSPYRVRLDRQDLLNLKSVAQSKQVTPHRIAIVAIREYLSRHTPSP